MYVYVDDSDVCGISAVQPDIRPPGLINGSLGLDRDREEVEGHDTPPPVAFIIGGQDAQKGQFPWQVSIWEGGEHLCGGTLINDLFVLTAAHCVRGDSKEDDFSAFDFILGSTQIDGGVEEALHVSAERVFRHPDYVGGGDYSNDIALVKVRHSSQSNVARNTTSCECRSFLFIYFQLSESVANQMSEYILPACAPTNDIDFVNQALTGVVSGWGKTSYPCKTGL